MDLLSGYGSDGSSSDDNDAPTNFPLPSAEKGPVTMPRPRTQAPVISKRGKKLVSLHAVLPPHILEQLTNGTIDSDDDQEVASRKTKNIPKANSNAKRGSTDGLSSFLSELSSAKGSAVSKKVLATEKMGHSFLQTTTTSVSKKNYSDRNEVVDIHSQQLPVETVHVHEHDNNDGNQKVRINTNVTIPVIQRNAAPTVRMPQVNVPHPPAFQTTLQPASDATPVTRSTTLYPVDEDDEPSLRVTKKRSRKEMEKLLRSGNMEAVDDQDNVRSLDLEEHVYVPQMSAQPKPSGTGVRVAPVAMYDTKAGKDVVLGSNMSGRGKNQINYLMASAAAFEANEVQQAKAKTQRASAKRKYGW